MNAKLWMFSSDVPESPERVRRVRWRPWEVYVRSSRGKRPREQQWCRGNQEQLARKSEDLRRVAKPLWPPCPKQLLRASFGFGALKFDNKTIGQVPAWHSIQPLNQHPWLQQAYVYLNDLYVRERMGCRRPNQTPSASPWSFVSGPVSGGNQPPSSFSLSLSILFPWTLWDAWVTSLCSLLWGCVLCDACVLCNCSTKHPWWQSDRHAFSHSTPAIFIEMQHLAQVSGSV